MLCAFTKDKVVILTSKRFQLFCENKKSKFCKYEIVNAMCMKIVLKK